MEPIALHRKERNSGILGAGGETVSPRIATKKQGIAAASRFVAVKFPPVPENMGKSEKRQ
jgi:hypothetical protein